MTKADRLLEHLNNDIRKYAERGDIRRKALLEDIRHELCGLSGDAREAWADGFGKELDRLCRQSMN